MRHGFLPDCPTPASPTTGWLALLLAALLALAPLAGAWDGAGGYRSGKGGDFGLSSAGQAIAPDRPKAAARVEVRPSKPATQPAAAPGGDAVVAEGRRAEPAALSWPARPGRDAPPAYQSRAPPQRTARA